MLDWDQICKDTHMYIHPQLQHLFHHFCHRKVLSCNIVVNPCWVAHKFKPQSCKISAVHPTENRKHGYYDTVSWAGMNKSVKIRIDPKPELAIPTWYLCLSLCTCVCTNVCFCSLWQPITAQSQSLIDFPANSNEALRWGTIEQSSLSPGLLVPV